VCGIVALVGYEWAALDALRDLAEDVAEEISVVEDPARQWEETMSHPQAACEQCEFRSDPLDVAEVAEHVAQTGHAVETIAGPADDDPGQRGRGRGRGRREYEAVTTGSGEPDRTPVEATVPDADNVDRVRCEAPAVYAGPVADQDAARLAALVDEARAILVRITNLTTPVMGTVALVGNEDAVLDALVGLAEDAAAEAAVVRARVTGTEHTAP